ncbi:hypothetical protein Tco_0768536 [Tanacetum coccineum]
MLCYLTGMEPYYIQCIKDGPFQPKTVEGANKPKAQWSNHKRRVVNQDQCLKSIIISCLPDDIMERFVYEDNLISRRYPESKKALITSPLTTLISTALFSNNIEKVSDDEEMTQVKVLMALSNDELVVGKNHARNGEWIDVTMRKVNILLSMDEDVDWQIYLKYIRIDLKFVEEQRILVPESQAINECLGLIEAPTDPESSKESGSEPLIPLPPLKNLQGASSSSEVMPLTYQDHSPKKRPGLGIMKHTKPKIQESSSKSVSGPVTLSNTEPVISLVPTKDNRTFDHKVYVTSLKNSENYKAQPYHYDHATSRHNLVVLVRGGVLPKSSYSSEFLVGVSCNTCGSIVHSTTDHNDFKHFKRDISGSLSGTWTVDTQGGYGSINYGGIVFSKVAFVNGLKYNLNSISQLCDAKYIVQFDDKQGKFNAKADDGYFLGYSFLSKALRVFNTKRQQIEKTYHVTFKESMEAIWFTNTSLDEIRINDSSRYPPDEFLYEDDPSRQYQENSNISYYITPHNHSLIKLIKITHVPEVITSNEQNTPRTKDNEVLLT